MGGSNKPSCTGQRQQGLVPPIETCGDGNRVKRGNTAQKSRFFLATDNDSDNASYKLSLQPLVPFLSKDLGTRRNEG